MRKYKQIELNDEIIYSKMELPVRVYNALSKNEYWEHMSDMQKPKTIGDLIKYSPHILLRLPNFGRHSLNILQEELKNKYNASLSSSPEYFKGVEDIEIERIQFVVRATTDKGDKTYTFNNSVLSDPTISKLFEDLKNYIERDINKEVA